MKISKRYLRRLIKEETANVLREFQATGEGEVSGKTAKVLSKIPSERALRDGTSERKFVGSMLQGIASSDPDDLKPWGGEFWNDERWDVAFSDDGSSLGGQLSSASVDIIKQALKSKGHTA